LIECLPKKIQCLNISGNQVLVVHVSEYYRLLERFRELEELSILWDGNKTTNEHNKIDGQCIQTKLKTLHIQFLLFGFEYKSFMNTKRDAILMCLKCSPNLRELSLQVV